MFCWGELVEEDLELNGLVFNVEDISGGIKID